MQTLFSWQFSLFEKIQNNKKQMFVIETKYMCIKDSGLSGLRRYKEGYGEAEH